MRSDLLKGFGVVLLAMTLVTTPARGQYYDVGATLSQQTLAKTVTYCANGSGSETLGNLLVPGAGESTRVLWLSFFASW